MKHVLRAVGVLSLVLAALVPAVPLHAAGPTTRPTKVYVPYEKLRGVFEAEGQGVFLPYDEFRRLWRASRREPAAVAEAPAPYLISTARFTGTVGEKLATLRMELTVDILADGWVEVPIGLGDVAVSEVAFAGAAEDPADRPLLRADGGSYRMLTRGKGRRTLVVDFVRQLVTSPGLNVLGFQLPAAAITTLELTIPEENMKVDVEPMLAAGTEQVAADGGKATRLRAFLGSSPKVKLSWKPTTQAAADLEPVIVSEQLQHLHVAEALVTHEVRFTYDIRRRGVDDFTVQLPGGFRVTAVEGANIAKWDIAAAGKARNLKVQLFSAAKGRYELTVRMELFLKESSAKVALEPVLTQQVLRRTGLLAVTHSPRRSVELTGAKNLARVDTARLPKALRGRAGATAWRFITGDYAGTLAVDTVAPRIAARHVWALGIADDRRELRGRLSYRIERAGVFQLALGLPEPWEVLDIGPAGIVDDYQLAGEGEARTVNILLKREVLGELGLTLTARAPRSAPDAAVDFRLPLAAAEHLRLYSGQVIVQLADRLRGEVAELRQLQSLPLRQADMKGLVPALPAAMAFAFRALDRARPAGLTLDVAVKPTQVSAVVHRLVNIQPGSIREEAVIDYRVRYAPVDTFYLKMPAELADAGVSISGKDIKEKPRLDALPADQRADGPGDGAGEADPGAPEPGAPATAPGGEQPDWAYYKVVLQAPVLGEYRVKVDLRRGFQAGQTGQVSTVEVPPILAAGRLSDQTGHVAVAKADTLAIGEPKVTGLLPGDPASEADLPRGDHRRQATLAFRYTTPPFALALPVAVQKEAAVFTTIATGAVLEQVLGRDGAVSTHATFLLATSRGDRLPVTFPPGAEVSAVLLNGTEAPVEAGTSPDVRVVRLPPSAGQVSRLVLELRYNMKPGGDALAPPALPEDIPVQQTLWRVRMPVEKLLLDHNPAYTRMKYGAAGQLRSLASGYPSEVGFKFAHQRKAYDFTRQGAPEALALRIVGREVFSVVVWLAIAAVGVAALRIDWFGRCVLVLAAGVAVLVVRLFAPLLVKHVVLTGMWVGVIVIGLWIAHGLFRRLPAVVRRRRPPSAGPAPAGAGGSAPQEGPPVLEPSQAPPDQPPSRPQNPPGDTHDAGDASGRA